MNAVPTVRIRSLEAVTTCALFTLDSAGSVDFWSREAEQLFGYSPAEIEGAWLGEIFSSGPAHVAERWLQAAREQGRFAGEHRHLRRDGEAFWAEIIIQSTGCSSSTGFLVMVRDIAERRRWRRLDPSTRVDQATNAVVTIDASGKLLSVSGAAEEMFGYCKEELLGQPVEQLIPGFPCEGLLTNRVRYLAGPAGGEAEAGRSLYGRRKDGAEFAAEISLHPFEAKEGACVLVSIHDLTQRRQRETQSHRMLIESAHAARLSAVGEMVSGLAHEINQPLAAASNYLRGCIRLAQNGAEVRNSDLIQWMELAAAQTTRACEIVTRLKAFVKKGEPQRTRVDLNQLIEQSIALSIAAPEAGGDAVSVQLQLDWELPAITIDRVQIQQVLANLFRNAIEAMRETPPERRILQVQTQLCGDMVKVCIMDFGCGIAPEHLQRLYEAFFTTKESGIGLGLSISRSIIEQHRGELSVTSTPGQGTTFSFTLPLELVESDG